MHQDVLCTLGIPIRTIHATKQYPCLDIQGWKQDTRWRRKQCVVEVVSTMFNPAMPGNAFTQRDHDLSNWHQHAACTTAGYCRRHCTMPCFPPWSPAVCVCMQTCCSSGSSRYPHNIPASNPATVTANNIKTTTGSKPFPVAELRGKMERTLAQLGIDHYQLLRGELSNSARLLRVHQQHPNIRHPKAFLQALNSYNQPGH